VNIVFDIGNTQQKVAVFSGDEILFHAVKNNFSATDIESILTQYPASHTIISSVHASFTHADILSEKTTLLLFDHHTLLPIQNKYATPETLGKDRLAAAVGAWFYYKGHNVLVIDAGTCIKYDFINAQAEYLGGAISPGLMMRFKAMNNYTAKLPLIPPEIIMQDNEINLTGDSTMHALLAGGGKGAIFEAEGFINAYEERYPGLEVILTGGDASFFELHLKRKIFALPNLVLYGLNTILEHNLKKT